jgi:hypothetical protein
MMRTLTRSNSLIIAGFFTIAAAACNNIVGLNDFSVGSGSSGGTEDMPSRGGTDNTPQAGSSSGGNPTNGGTDNNNNVAGGHVTGDAGAGG